MIEGAVILLAGILAGWLGRGARRLASREPEPTRPICSCGHTRGFHDKNVDKCRGVVDFDVEKKGYFDHTEQRECTCQHYDGPEPLPTYYTPEITG